MELRGKGILNPIRFALGCGVGFCLGFPIIMAVTSAYPETKVFQPYVAALILILLWLWIERRQKASEVR